MAGTKLLEQQLKAWKQNQSEASGKTETTVVSEPPKDERSEKMSPLGQPIREPDACFLPSDTKEAVASTLLAYKDQRVENFALLLNKCALQERKPKKFETQEHKSSFLFFRKGDEKKRIIEYRLSPNFHCVPLTAIRQRHVETIRALRLEGTNDPITCKVDWRLIVGLGNESVYETSMTLHHIYGIPYIPGQAVKGVLRSWLIIEKFGTILVEKEDGTGKEEKLDLKNAEERALKEEWFCDIFGCPSESVYGEARQGKVYFFDAFPTKLNKDSIQPDIMNPHYAPYYSEKKPPADYHNPIPVTFLTVQDTAFEFFIGIKNDHNKNTITGGKFDGKSILQVVQEELKNALSQRGLGAKTAVGYGYFQPEEQ